MNKNRITLLAACTLLLTPMTKAQSKMVYPMAPQSDTTVVDDYFGIKISDPYRPLEDDGSAVTAAWVEAENALTRGYIDAIPFRNSIKERLTTLNNYHKNGLPSRSNDGMYYQFRNDGLRNQSVLYRSDKLGGEQHVFLDPNLLSTDGTVALTGVSQSNDGRYTAYTIARSGSDWTEIYVLDTATGNLLPEDHIEWAKFTSPVWHGDGFYYSAYPRPEGSTYSGKNEGQNVYYHRIGTPKKQDLLIYSDPKNPLFFHHVGVDKKGTVMWLTQSGQGTGNSLLVKDISNTSSPIETIDLPWVAIESTQDYDISPVAVKDGIIYLLTYQNAPKGKLVAVPVKTANDRTTWRDIVPESKDVLVNVERIGNGLFALVYNVDASSRLSLIDFDGNAKGEVKLPGYGSISLSTDSDSDEVFYSFSSFITPSEIYSLDVNTLESTLIEATKVPGFDSSQYVTEQVFYPSADGTSIPMFITYKKGLKRDGNNPVYLYGYGGFNISLYPSFSANRLLWLENGGIYAQANLRGGSEYGEEWHQAGTKMNKLNVFNDFIAAAEYMIKEGWTKPELMTIEGGSNGGLLVGACVNIRPDLFAVAIPRVGVMDMLRYHLFTIGWNWAPDYGTVADSPEMAKYLINYSPMHNIANPSSVPYPAILVTTADHDDRVVPAHSFKYAATLQAAETGDKPKLIRIDSKAGHGAGKPISKVIDEYTDIYSFIFENIGRTPKQ